jgi:hypothetical protein
MTKDVLTNRDNTVQVHNSNVNPNNSELTQTHTTESQTTSTQSPGDKPGDGKMDENPVKAIDKRLDDRTFGELEVELVIAKIAALNSTIFSLVDLLSVYNQVITEKELSKFTAFSCSLRNFEYCRLHPRSKRNHSRN